MAHTSNTWESLTAALVISGPDLLPAVIGERLGIQPEQSWKSADKPENRAWAGCLLLRSSATSITQLLDDLLPLVEPHLPVLAELSQEGCHVAISFRALVSTGDRLLLPPEALARLGALGITVSFEPENMSPDTSEEDLWDELGLSSDGGQ
jgi:hypothetical protein